MGLTVRPLGQSRFDEERMNWHGQNAAKGGAVEVDCRVPCGGLPALKQPGSILQCLIRHRRAYLDQKLWGA